MIESALLMLPLVALSAVFYLTLFCYFSIPNLMASSAIVGVLKKSKKYKRIHNLPLVFPALGLAFYSTIDFFEANGLYTLWFVLLGCISLAPVAVYYLFRYRL